MDSDNDDEQIGVKKQVGKKTKGRKKKSTTTAKIAKSNKKTANSAIGRGRGRIVKNQILDSESEEEQIIEPPTNKKLKLESPTHSKNLLKDTDKLIDLPTSGLSSLTGSANPITTVVSTSISAQLFSSTPRLNCVPLHENKPLNWNHRVNLIGEKSLEQRVHQCDICKEPILNYGRLLPCKHVFCYDCAIDLQSKSSGCLRCNERIVRCERNLLNSVFMCNHDKQCKRTYLSQRDLHSHIQHRHTKKEKSNSSSEKSLKMRSFNLSSNKDDYLNSHTSNLHSSHLHSGPASSFSVQKPNNGHHYPQPSLQTFRWVKNIQNYSEQTNLRDVRKPK